MCLINGGGKKNVAGRQAFLIRIQDKDGNYSNFVASDYIEVSDPITLYLEKGQKMKKEDFLGEYNVNFSAWHMELFNTDILEYNEESDEFMAKEVGKTRLSLINNKSGKQYNLIVQVKDNSTGFVWGKNNWNFNNSSVQGYFRADAYGNHINNTYLSKLKSNLTNTEYQTVFDKEDGWLYEDFCGSCYGMSSTSLLAEKGFLPYSSYLSGATRLNQLKWPTQDSNVSSLITYYQMLQVKDVIQQQYRTVPNKTNKENIQKIISLLENNHTVLVGFQKSGWGGHAILAYDYEYGSYTWDGVSYQGRIKVCDPNKSISYNDSCNIYFNTTSYNWTIPYYSDMKSTSGARFNYAGANANEINKGGYLTGTSSVNVKNYVARINAKEISNNRSVVKVDKSNGNYVIKNNASDDIVEEDAFILGNESIGLAGYNLYDADSAYKLSQNTATSLKASIEYDNCQLEAASKAGKSVIFDKSGFVSVEGESANYGITMTYNNGNPTDWFTVDVKGVGANNVSLQKVNNGYILAGDHLKNVFVCANNKINDANILFSTEKGKAFIYEKNSSTVGIKVDSDNNGSFDKEVVGKINIDPTSYEQTTNYSDETERQEKKKTTSAPKTVIKKVYAKKKSLKVSWKNVKGIKGYKIQYSLNKNFKKAKTKVIKKASKTSITLKKLKRKKKYYLRIRTYKVVNGKTYQSAWSKVKSKKTK